MTEQRALKTAIRKFAKENGLIYTAAKQLLEQKAKEFVEENSANILQSESFVKPEKNTFLTLDSRKRANLVSVADRERYAVTRESNGRIILDPAVVLTEDELIILQNHDLWDKVEQSHLRGGHHARRSA